MKTKMIGPIPPYEFESFAEKMKLHEISFSIKQPESLANHSDLVGQPAHENSLYIEVEAANILRYPELWKPYGEFN